MSGSIFDRRRGSRPANVPPAPAASQSDAASAHPAVAVSASAGPLASSLPAWVNTAMVLLFLAGAWVTALATRGSLWAQVQTALREAKVDPAGLAAVPWFLGFSILIALLAFRRLLWNLTTRYEFWPDRARIILGGFTRAEQAYPWSVFKDARFKQHPLQMPFRSGTLVLESRDGPTLDLEECPEAEHWAQEIRPQIAASAPAYVPVLASRASASSSVSAAPAAVPAQPQVVVVKEKSSGCMTCLILIVILILTPMVLGVIFKIAVLTSILNTVRQIFGH